MVYLLLRWSDIHIGEKKDKEAQEDDDDDGDSDDDGDGRGSVEIKDSHFWGRVSPL